MVSGCSRAGKSDNLRGYIRQFQESWPVPTDSGLTTSRLTLSARLTRLACRVFFDAVFLSSFHSRALNGPTVRDGGAFVSARVCAIQRKQLDRVSSPKLIVFLHDGAAREASLVPHRSGRPHHLAHQLRARLYDGCCAQCLRLRRG